MPPQLAPFYAHVHPLFWPVLWLNLEWVRQWLERHDVNILVSVTWWGRVRIITVGDHRLAWRRPEPVRPGWDDPVWQSSVPGAILAEGEMATCVLPQSCAGLISAPGAPAFALPCPDTS